MEFLYDTRIPFLGIELAFCIHGFKDLTNPELVKWWKTHEYGGLTAFTVLHHFIEGTQPSADFGIHRGSWTQSSMDTNRYLYIQKNWSRISKRYLHVHVHSSIIHYSQAVGATQAPTDRWMVNKTHSMNIQESMIQL